MEAVQTHNVQSLEGSFIPARLENGPKITTALNSFIRSLLRTHFCNTFYAV